MTKKQKCLDYQEYYERNIVQRFEELKIPVNKDLLYGILSYCRPKLDF